MDHSVDMLLRYNQKPESKISDNEHITINGKKYKLVDEE